MKRSVPDEKRPPIEVPLSRKKRVAFTAVLICLPMLFLGMVEGALRAVGYGDSYPLFVPVEGRPDYLYQNREVARRYFAGLNSVPNSLYDFFKADKDPGTFRIFVQGGSSAAGYPFYYGGAFSRMLEQRLKQTFPDRRIEVVNTAMAAVNSYTLLDFADEILAQKPDAVLIYAGHNEYYGALGVGSSQSAGVGLVALTRGYIRLMKLRTGQAVRNLLSSAGGLLKDDGDRPPSRTLMEQMVGRQTIALGSPAYKLGLHQFRDNLSDLLAVYREHGIPVFIGTLASNERDLPPFISGHEPGTDTAAWRAHYREAADLASRDHLPEALAATDEVIALDTLSASAYFLRGRILERLGRFAEARRAYLAAKDRDELRFRAPEAANRIIRLEAVRHGAYLVDVHAALENASPHGIIGSNLMMEHLHPNVEGYLLMADAFYEALRRERQIGDWEAHYVPLSDARREILLTPVDSLVGVFRTQRLMGSWPFKPPGTEDHALDTLRGANPVEQIALDLYRGEVSWFEANAALRRFYERGGDYHQALRAALAAVQEYPFLPDTYLAAGNVLVEQTRYDEALTYFEAANDLQESSATQTMIGSILLKQGDRKQAVARLERALELDSSNQQTLYNLSGAYAVTQRYDKARATVTRLLHIAPGHADARRLLLSLPPAGGPPPH
ncbi:MAG TPA: tetratricopeptide repeat protein [Rhodothermales bacterium]|nr:tetratricopeptide repeat protein [Rhodothermales bacterium]